MTRKRLWMNRISGIVCLLLWIAFIIFLSGTTGKIAGMALGIMLLVAVIYNLYLPKEVSIHLIIPAYAQKEEKITGRLCISNTGVFPVLSGKVFLQVKKTISAQIRMVFLLPIVTAALHVLAAFPMIRMILAVMNLNNGRLFAYCLLGAIAVFTVIYLLVYKMTSKTYYRIVGHQIG